MIVALTGNNSFALRRRLDELMAEFAAEHGELAVERIDADIADGQAILDAVQSLPFLAKRKLVVVRGLGTNKAAAEQIEQILGSISDNVDLVLYEPITDKRTVYYKTLKAKTQLEEHDELDALALAKWLVNEAKGQGANLSLPDANYLVQRVGANQAILAQELTKLTLYDISVSRRTIDLLTDATPQGKVFDLLDAVFGGDKQKALKLYEEQRAMNVEPQAILAMMAWQLNLIALAKHAGKRSASQVAGEAGVSPYPLTKAMGLASKLSETKLKTMVGEALEIDWRGKTTAIDLDEALKAYIVTL